MSGRVIQLRTSQYAVYTAGSNVQYEILKVQVHTTAARKESPWTASSRPTRYVNRVFAAPRPAYSTCTPDSHTSARRTPARTRTRPYGSRPGASSSGAPSRASHGHAASPRRPRTAIARATAPSPARTPHIVDARAKGRRWRRRRPRPPPSRRQVVCRPGRGGGRPAAYLRRQGGEAKTICGPTGVRSATQTAHEGYAARCGGDAGGDAGARCARAGLEEDVVGRLSNACPPRQPLDPLPREAES